MAHKTVKLVRQIMDTGLSWARNRNYYGYDPYEPLKREISDFLSSIINNHNPKVTGEDGLEARIIADAVLESINTGEKIDTSNYFLDL